MTEEDPYAAIPVDVLTGFLGAGKTTLVRRWLQSGVLANSAILVNEFADLPVDQRLIGLSGASATLLGDRCICCVTDGNLRVTLLDLLRKRGSGELPPFARILIETSGIADPSPLLATLMSDPALKLRLRVGHVITLVDLCHAAITLAEHEEALAQIIAADIVYLTKADLAEPDSAATLSGIIGRLNPIAQILAMSAGEAPPDPFADRMRKRRMVPLMAYADGGARHGEIAATVLRWPEPIDWAVFASWLSLLLHRHGARILRMKGSLTLAGSDAKGPVMLQSVRHIVHMPEHLPPGDGPSGTEIVVIVRGVDPRQLERSFRIFMGGRKKSTLSEALLVS